MGGEVIDCVYMSQQKGKVEGEALRRRWKLETVHKKGRSDPQGPREGLLLDADSPDELGDPLLVCRTA